MVTVPALRRIAALSLVAALLLAATAPAVKAQPVPAGDGEEGRGLAMAWSWPVRPGETLLAATATGDTVTAFTTQRLLAVDPVRGRVLWEQPHPEPPWVMVGPVLERGLVAWVLHRGRQGRSHRGEGVIEVREAVSGELRFSALLPGYLPLALALRDSLLLASCVEVGGPQGRREVVSRWRRDEEKRHGCWLVALDLATGLTRWSVPTDEWPVVLSADSAGLLVAERIGGRGDHRDRVVLRDPATGLARWQHRSGLDRARYVASLPHPRGTAVMSDGAAGTVSHLLHSATGQRMGGLPLHWGAHRLRSDTLWVAGRREDLLFRPRTTLQAVHWNGFVLLGSRDLKPGGTLTGHEWWAGEEGRGALGEPDAWAFFVPRLPPELRRPLPLDGVPVERSTRLLLPVDRPADREGSSLFYGRGFYAAEWRDSSAVWYATARSLEGRIVWSHRTPSRQPPVWLEGPWRGWLLTGWEGALAGLDPSYGTRLPLADPAGTITLDLQRLGRGVLAVRGDGLFFYRPWPAEERGTP